MKSLYLTKKDWVILVLTFSLILLCAPLFVLVDETSLEGSLPWYFGIPLLVGFVLEMTINYPILFFTSLGGGAFFNAIILSDWYLGFLSFVTATLYTSLLAWVLSRSNKK